MIYAFVRDGVVMDIEARCASGISLERLYHPDFLSFFHEIPAGIPVEAGWLYDAASGEFSPPAQ